MATFYASEMRRREVLYSALREHKQNGSPIELILNSDKDLSALEKIGSITHRYTLIPYVSIVCSPEDASVLVNQVHGRKQYNDFSRVRSVELSNKVSIPSPFIKKLYSKKADYWHLEAIGAYSARRNSTGSGTKIGIIDTGAEFAHPEISENFGKTKGYNFVADNDNPKDDNGHGTHVAGLIAGASCGVALDAELYALKMLDKNGSGSESDAMAAIEWAVLNNLDIVNMSFGASNGSGAFQRIINAAAQRGLIMVAAAGNEGGYYPSFPASFDNVIAVAAIDEDLQHAEFSNIFPTNDISAPGVNITSSYLNNSYAVLDGTSMAAPLVSGSLALIKNQENLEQILKESASPLSSVTDFEDYEVFGAGLVRADIMSESYSRKKFFEIARKLLW